MSIRNKLLAISTRIAMGFAMAMCLLTTGSWSQSTAQTLTNSIEAIEVAGQQGGNIVVRITLKNAPANPPVGFTVNDPPRIAFDFAGTGNGLGKNTREVGEGDLRLMNIVQAGDRTRVVMNLTKPLGYDTPVSYTHLTLPTIYSV